MTLNPPLEVLLVSRPGDEHGDIVERELRHRRCIFERLSLNEWRRCVITWRPGGELLLGFEGERRAITPKTTVWWRRPGWVVTDDLADDEGELAQAEGLTMLYGLLAAVHPRWVDHPYAVSQAESKPWQLAIAEEVGIRVPGTLVTNSPGEAKRMMEEGGAVAKSASSGSGIAPFVDEVPSELVPLVAELPVLLQRTIRASSDLRVVTIGGRALVWRRKREADEPLDWRQADPQGAKFLPVSDDSVTHEALRMTAALDLSMSVQDWLETSDGPVFLEANPQGQWLFLATAGELVTTALADHLLQA